MARAEKQKQLCNTNNIGPKLGPKCIFLKAGKLCHNREVALQFLKCRLPQSESISKVAAPLRCKWNV
jgi:hypothetical protein